MTAQDLQSIQKYAPMLDGVFAMSDLKILFGKQSEAALYKKVRTLLRTGVLIKVKRGIYATRSASLEAISSRICPGSYISTGTVLARELVVGSRPVLRVQAVKVGRPRTYSCELGTIEHLSIKPELYFGFENRGGINTACVEKAFLDTCYYYLKGRRFSFDPVTDVNLDSLNKDRITEYSQVYDSQFREYLAKIWGIG